MLGQTLISFLPISQPKTMNKIKYVLTWTFEELDRTIKALKYYARNHPRERKEYSELAKELQKIV